MRDDKASQALEVDSLRIVVKCTFLVLLNPNAYKVSGYVVTFCQTMQRFSGEEFLRHPTFELDAMTAVLCHGSSFRKPGRPVNSSSPSVRPRGRTPIRG
jgi:hypothetical protein